MTVEIFHQRLDLMRKDVFSDITFVERSYFCPNMKASKLSPSNSSTNVIEMNVAAQSQLLAEMSTGIIERGVLQHVPLVVSFTGPASLSSHRSLVIIVRSIRREEAFADT